MNITRCLQWAVAVLVVFPAGSLLAGTITYTDRTLWNNDVLSLFSTNFSANSSGTALTPGQQVAYNTSNGYLTTDIQVLGYVDAGYMLTQAFGNSSSLTYYNWGSGPILRSADKTASNSVTMRVNFRNGGAATQVSAFGLDLGLSGGAGLITITPQNLPSYTINTLAQPTLQFAGLTSDTHTFGYVDLTLSDANRYIVLDNVAFGNYQLSGTPSTGGGGSVPTEETPDAATLLYVATGLSCICLSRHRRICKKA